MNYVVVPRHAAWDIKKRYSKMPINFISQSKSLSFDFCLVFSWLDSLIRLETLIVREVWEKKKTEQVASLGLTTADVGTQQIKRKGHKVAWMPFTKDRVGFWSSEGKILLVVSSFTVDQQDHFKRTLFVSFGSPSIFNVSLSSSLLSPHILSDPSLT